jgi:methyl-accepting chemotaxis protein
MSKNLLIPSCIAAMALTGSLAGFSAFQFVTGVKADRFYSMQTNNLQSAALNSIMLSMRAASDASYFGQLQQVAGQVDKTVSKLRSGSTTQGIPPLPASGEDSLDLFENSWIKVRDAIEQIAATRGSNTAFERQASEATKLAETLISGTENSVSRIEASPLVNERIKQILTKAKNNLVEGIEVLANTSAANTDSLQLALDASKAYVATLTAVGSSIPRADDLIQPLLKSFKTAQALSRTTLKAVEANSGALDNGPHAKTIWAERENLENAIGGLQLALNSLPKTHLITPMIMLGAVFASILMTALGVTLILRDSRRNTHEAESMANNIQSSQKERSQELRMLIDEMESVGNGDLTVEFREGNGSTNEIASTLNTVFPKFREIVQDVQQTIVSLSAASEQTLSMARNTERSRTEQVQAIQHIAKLIDELSTFTGQLDGVISRTRESSYTVSTQIGNGSTAVSEVHEGVIKLSQSNLNILHHAKAMTENIQSLEQLVDVVKRVANQAATVAYNAHLVADVINDEDLNKRIRISAVAMDKLKSAAKEAADQITTNLQAINIAAKDTQYVLDESANEIKSLTGMSSNALKAMAAINDQTKQLVEGIVSVAGKTADLNKRSKDVSETMDQIHHYASDHSSASEQTATAISNLNSQAQRVGTSLAHFRV